VWQKRQQTQQQQQQMTIQQLCLVVLQYKQVSCQINSASVTPCHLQLLLLLQRVMLLLAHACQQSLLHQLLLRQ
jgi:hypothetical protein